MTAIILLPFKEWFLFSQLTFIFEIWCTKASLLKCQGWHWIGPNPIGRPKFAIGCVTHVQQLCWSMESLLESITILKIFFQNKCRNWVWNMSEDQSTVCCMPIKMLRHVWDWILCILCIDCTGTLRNQPDPDRVDATVRSMCCSIHHNKSHNKYHAINLTLKIIYLMPTLKWWHWHAVGNGCAWWAGTPPPSRITTSRGSPTNRCCCRAHASFLN